MHNPQRFNPLLFLFSCLLALAVAPAWALDHPRVLMVVASQQVAEVEYNPPHDLLVKNGAQVRVAGINLAPATTYSQQTIQPDLRIDEAKAGDYDAIVIIGGEGAIRDLWGHAGLQKLVKEAAQQRKLVSAICAGPVVLARAGLLENRKATAFYRADILREFQSAKATYTGNVVEEDGLLLTANGPTASNDFAMALAKKLKDF